MVKKRALVYGAGKIFKLHYSEILYCLYDDIIIIDPFLPGLEAEKLDSIMQKKPINAYFTNEISESEINDKDHVYIFTPHRSHYNLIRTNSNAERIFIEKPVVLQYKNWQKLQAHADVSRTVLWPAYHHFYTSLKDIIEYKKDSYSINDVNEISIQFNRGPFPERKWGLSFGSKLHAGGGAILDLGPHIFSIIAIIIPDIINTSIKFTEKDFLFSPRISELETYFSFAGELNSDVAINGRIGYGLHGYTSRRVITIKLRNSSTITWEDGDLKLDGESLTPRYPKSNLAFKNMLHDFYKGLNCSYSESIGWIIKSVEDCYSGYYPITDLTQ